MRPRAIDRYDEWLRSLDPARRQSTTTVSSFVGVAVIAMAGMAVTAYLPGPRELFRFPFWKGFAWLVPALLPGFVMAPLDARGGLSLRAFGAFSLVGVFFFQGFMWSLVHLSAMPGATVMAAFPVLLVSFHGYLFQSSFRYPFALAVSAAALVPALVLAPTPEHRSILVLAGVMALSSHVLLGYYSGLDASARERQDALRRAVDAQILGDRTREVAKVSEALMELRGRRHDAGNALSGLLLNLPRFVSLLEHEWTPEERKEAGMLGRALRQSLERLKQILLDAAAQDRKSSPEAVEVHPAELLQEVVGEVGRLHPRVKMAVRPANGADHVRLRFFGGAEALRRSLHNLVLNACEGDGRRGATVITVELSLQEERQEFVIRFVDDGPGFREGQILSRFDRLETTKPHGTGLGLYTSSRVLSASGGRLTRENRGDGVEGASVTMYLRLDAGLS